MSHSYPSDISREQFAQMEGLVGVSLEVVQRHELHSFAVLPKLWVPEGILPGWKSVVGSGRTAKESSIPATKSGARFRCPGSQKIVGSF
jgi:hypothetical protein